MDIYNLGRITFFFLPWIIQTCKYVCHLLSNTLECRTSVFMVWKSKHILNKYYFIVPYCVKEKLLLLSADFLYHCKCSDSQADAGLRGAAIDENMRLAAVTALHIHMLVSDSCVGAEWQGPVWVVNHSDSALGRRSGMAPVNEWPLTFSVRTEASLNNSMKRGKKIKKKKQLGVNQLWSNITVSIFDTALMRPLIIPA